MIRLSQAPRRAIAALCVLAFPLAASAAPRSPTEMFGFTPGDDYKLASYEMQEAFYRQLAAESDRQVVVDMPVPVPPPPVDTSSETSSM